jgi:hypothetical protein
MAAVTVLAAPQLASLDRVLWLRVEVDEHGVVSGVVAGTRHRRPVTVRVDAATARSLSGSGVPTVTRRVGTAS